MQKKQVISRYYFEFATAVDLNECLEEIIYHFKGGRLTTGLPSCTGTMAAAHNIAIFDIFA